MTPKENATGAMHPSGIQKTHTRKHYTQAGRQDQGVQPYSLAGLVCDEYREAEVASASRERALELAQHHLRDACWSVTEQIEGFSRTIRLLDDARAKDLHENDPWLGGASYYDFRNCWTDHLYTCMERRLMPGLLGAHKAQPRLSIERYEDRICALVAAIEAGEAKARALSWRDRRLMRLYSLLTPMLNELSQLARDILRDIEGCDVSHEAGR